jgi:hypothetical protein
LDIRERREEGILVVVGLCVLHDTATTGASTAFFFFDRKGTNGLGSVMRLHMHLRRNLRNVALMGISDFLNGGRSMFGSAVGNG